MSFSITIFHVSVKTKVDTGHKLDEFEHPKIDAALMNELLTRLSQYGYALESESKNCSVFVRYVEQHPIQVSVYGTQITFTVPYSNIAIAEALQDASELSDSDDLILFDPQNNEWLEKDGWQPAAAPEL